MQVGCQNLNNPAVILMHSFILLFINPFPAKLSYLTQLQVGEKLFIFV